MALLTPFLALAAGWVAGVVATTVPGVELDPDQIVAFMIAVTTSVLGAAWKWLQGWQQHEQLVATTPVEPIKPPSPPPPAAPPPQ